MDAAEDESAAAFFETASNACLALVIGASVVVEVVDAGASTTAVALLEDGVLSVVPGSAILQGTY